MVRRGDGPTLTARRNAAKVLGREGGTAYLEIQLLWWQEGNGEWCGQHWTGFGSRWDLEKFFKLAEDIVEWLHTNAGLSSSACNPTLHRIGTYGENKWYSSCPYELFISNGCDDLVWVHGLPETGQDKSTSGRKGWIWNSLLSLWKFSFWSEYKLSSKSILSYSESKLFTKNMFPVFVWVNVSHFRLCPVLPSFFKSANGCVYALLGEIWSCWVLPRMENQLILPQPLLVTACDCWTKHQHPLG